MKLYVLPASPNSFKVMAVVHHLGLPVETIVPDVRAGEHKNPRFLAFNPNGLLPILEDGDLHLWESNAIMQYLADVSPGGEALWPREPRGRADVSRWMCWQLSHWGQALGTILGQRIVRRMFRGEEPDEEVVAEALQDFRHQAGVLEGHLQARHYLAGAGPTLADFTVGSYLHYAGPAGIPLDDYPGIRAWYGRLAGLEAWQKALPRLAVGT